MKVSKKTKKILILSTLSIFLGFAGGFFMGSANEETLKKINLYREPTVILVDGKSLLNEALQQDLEHDSGKRTKVLIAENYNDLKIFSTDAQLIIARTCWLERLFSTSVSTQEKKINEWLKNQISPDFLTHEQQQQDYIPLLWTFGKTPHATEDRLKNIPGEKEYPMTLIGLKVIKEEKNILNILTSKKWMKKWMTSLPLATTYMTMDEELISNSQKARFFRELDFRKIKRINANSTDCDDFKLAPLSVDGKAWQ